MTATVAAAPPAPSATVPHTRRWWVELVTAPAGISPHSAAWDDLAFHAIEPNPFYERWMLLPAWEAFGERDRARVAFVYRDGPRSGDAPELCGLFPLTQAAIGNSPFRAWSLWQTHYTYLCTPLLRQGVANDTLQTFWNWLQRRRGGPRLWLLPHVNGDGPFQQTLIDVTNQRQAYCHVLRRYNRAVLRPMDSAEAYVAATLTGHHRQEFRRLRRRLGECGRLELRTSNGSPDLSLWAEQFLALEASGWKGREQTAFAALDRDATFFRRFVQGAAAQRQIAFLGLFLDDRPVALKLNLLSGDGSFAFKIAFDEAYGKFSPGVQLELDNIEWLHRQPGLKWMDSCAKSDHFMINRLWRDRRSIQDLVVSTGRVSGDLFLGLVPLAQSLRGIGRRLWQKHKPQSHRLG